MTARMKTVLGVLLGVYLLGFGMLTGVAIDRMRFDGQRSEVLGRYEQKLREWQAYRMALETAAGWREPLHRAEAALASGNSRAAHEAWQHAYRAAMQARTTEGLLAVGEAYLRIGEAARDRSTAAASARRLFLRALLQARERGDGSGAAAAAAAFASSGDREMADRGFEIATAIATQRGDAAALERIAGLQMLYTSGNPALRSPSR